VPHIGECKSESKVSDLLALGLSGGPVGLDVRLGVRSWESMSSSEVLLGLSVLGSSEEEGVGAYKRLIKNTSITNKLR
jgi:hypothetical protein